MSAINEIEPLVALGLNALEAEIYADLLQRTAITGYGVAKAIGKPAANVYKALETLEAKGGVVAEEGEKRHYRAVPVGEFLRRLETEFQEHRRAAVSNLTELPRDGGDIRIYQLTSQEQVYQRAREMLARTQRVVYLDIFPEAAAVLRAEIEETAARKVEVVAKVYSPETEFAGARVILEPGYRRVVERWPDQWANLYVDGSEFLIAHVQTGGEKVRQAIWSESPYLAYTFQTTFCCELAYTELKAAFGNQVGHDKLKETFSKTETYFKQDLPGYSRLTDWADRRQKSRATEQEGEGQ